MFKLWNKLNIFYFVLTDVWLLFCFQNLISLKLYQKIKNIKVIQKKGFCKFFYIVITYSWSNVYFTYNIKRFSLKIYFSNAIIYRCYHINNYRYNVSHLTCEFVHRSRLFNKISNKLEHLRMYTYSNLCI